MCFKLPQWEVYCICRICEGIAAIAHSQHKNEAHPWRQRIRFKLVSPCQGHRKQQLTGWQWMARSGPTAQVPYVPWVSCSVVVVVEGSRIRRPRSSYAWMTAQVASSWEFIVSYAISLLVFFANFLRRQRRQWRRWRRERTLWRRPRKLNVFHWILACQASGMESRLQTATSSSSNNRNNNNGGNRKIRGNKKPNGSLAPSTQSHRNALHGIESKSKCSTLFEIHEWHSLPLHPTTLHPSLLGNPHSSWSSLGCLANKFL